MARHFPGLLPMIVKNQFQCVHEIGFSLCKCLAFRENIRQFLKGGCVTSFRGGLVGGSELEMTRLGTHGKGRIADDGVFCQLEFRSFWPPQVHFTP